MNNFLRIWTVYGLTLVLSIPSVSFAQTIEAEASSELTKILDQARQADKIPGITFAVFNKSGIILKGQVGTSKLALSDRSSGLQPVNADHSIFRIASVSKLFTTLSLSRLLEKGILDRDAKLLDLRKTDIVRILRHHETANRLQLWNKVQLHQLMSHQSGIAKDISGSLLGFNSESLLNHSYPSMDVMYKNITAVEFLYPAGNIDTHFKYSNLAINILARVVEAYNPWNVSFSSYVYQSILMPLRMRSTFYDVPAWKRPQMVTGYGSLLPDGTRTEVPQALFAGSYEGSMGVATTATDLAQLGRELLKIINEESNVLSKPSVIKDWLTIKSPAGPTAGWASGPSWLVLPNENATDDIWFGHQGTGASERASLLANAEKNIGVAILFNCSDANREKYVQLILKQLKVERPELFLQKANLKNLAKEIIANARATLVATPAPVNFTPAPYPEGLEVQKYVGKYFADLVGFAPVTYDQSTGHLVFMGQKLAYDANLGEGHFRMPPISGPASTNSNKEPIVFKTDHSNKVISLKAFNIAIFKKVD